MKSLSCSINPPWLAAAVVAASLALTAVEARADQAWEVLTNLATNANPSDSSPLLEYSGNFYGTTRNGGTSGAGDVFKISPSGQWTELYSFTGGNDGNNPVGGLVLREGVLYGVTSYGGSNGAGTVFSLTPGGQLTPIYSFANGADGGLPNAGLAAGPGDLFYGTTYGGGSNGFGGIFSVSSSGQLTELYSFTNGADGLNVSSVLAQGQDGDWYGASQNGGADGNGTIFKITPAGAFTVLYTFTNGADGGFPNGGLRPASSGNFYDTAAVGGAYDNGIAFEVTPAGSLTVLYSFTGGQDGSTPGAVLAHGSDGNFYGTTLYSGDFFGGTAFRLTPSGEVTAILLFNNATTGSAPGELIEGTDLNFYGLTAYGGSNGGGTIIKFSSSVQQPGVQAQIPSSEYNALADMYNATAGSGWNEGAGWLDPAADYWYGMTVTPLQYNAAWILTAVSHVASLNLSFNNLLGSMPGSAGNFPFLQQLILDDNNLGGTIPDSITNLTRMQILNLDNNQLGGTIPDLSDALTSLQTIDCSSNSLTGPLPLFSAGYVDVSWNAYIFDTNSADYNAAQAMIANGQTVNYLPQNIPTILTEPANLAVCSGQTAVFSAEIDNGSTFQWFYNGQPLDDGPLVSGAQSASLALTNAQSSCAGGYNLIVSNSFGSATSIVATLSVLDAPVSFDPSGIQFSNGIIFLQITGLAGQGPVIIDTSTNLTQWTPLYTNPSGFGAAQFIDSNAASYPYRYYRARVPTP